VRVWELAPLLKAAPVRKLAAKELDELWADLGAADQRKAYRAVLLLSDDPESSLAYLRDRAQPPTVPNALAKLPKWIADLDSDDFATREKATEELIRLGTAARPALRKALESESLEVRKRAQALLERKGEPPVLLPEEMQAMRVIEVLQHIDKPEAATVLRRYAEVARGTPVQLEAQAALESRRR
jgi:hypothetical protein